MKSKQVEETGIFKQRKQKHKEQMFLFIFSHIFLKASNDVQETRLKDLYKLIGYDGEPTEPAELPDDAVIAHLSIKISAICFR